MILKSNLDFSLRAPFRVGLLIVATFIALAAPRAASAGFLDPLGFSSIGVLDLGAGVYTLDTTTMQLLDSSNNVLFTGVAYNQGTPAGSPYFGWNPTVAVFSFGSITLAAGATINARGDNPLALLSRSTVTFGNGAIINANGQDGKNSTEGGAGGLGGPGGGAGGNAGFGATGSSGQGPGGGAGGGPGLSGRGTGGGFGGQGATGFGTLIPGSVYGDLHTALQGGSGGGGVGGDLFRALGAGGGGGGGAVELGAVDSLTFGISAGIAARGGAFAGAGPALGTFLSGGGSGGAIFLHAPTITLGSFDVGGGNINGGGGRILVLNSTGTNAGQSSFNAVHGDLYGTDGVIEFGILGGSPIPEPATLTSALIGLAFGGVLVMRRRKHANSA